jgi:hypothetical protein
MEGEDMRWVFVILLPLTLASFAPAQSPVHFADANLKSVVEAELWVTDPTPADMLGLTFLDVSACGVANLTGLEYAANLRTFSCTHNRIRDLSPLAGLHNLEVLAFNTNEISDLSPLAGLHNLRDLNIHDNDISSISALAGLTKLQTLDLHANQIDDISAVSGMSSIETLILEGNQISSISALAGLSSLQSLRLGINEISDLSPLAGLSNLQTLSIYANQISNLSPLSGLHGLRTLYLSGNQISDIAPLASLTSLRSLDLANNPLGGDACSIYIPRILANNPGIYLQYNPCNSRRLSISATIGGSVIHPGEGQFEYESGTTVRLEAQANPNFAFVDFSGTHESTANPTFIIMDKDYDIHANFVSALAVIHVDDNGPTDPGPGNARISDSWENGTREHPFDSIQEAIGVAGRGATIFVHAGTYHESIDLLGKRIELTGFDPNDSGAAGWPVLDGGGTGPVISFTHNEDADCLVAGLVISGAKGRSAGAIRCTTGSPTIVNCLIAGNRTMDSDSAAVYCTDSRAMFLNCTFADNYAGAAGAALCLRNSPVSIVNSILWDNAPAQILSSGTGTPLVRYSAVAGGWPGAGNFAADPLFAVAGRWVYRNFPSVTLKPDDPNAAWVMGDYHLQSQAGRWDPKTHAWVQDKATSPCVDAGDPTTPVGHEPPPNGGIIDLGAYGGTVEAGKSLSPGPSL